MKKMKEGLLVASIALIILAVIEMTVNKPDPFVVIVALALAFLFAEMWAKAMRS